MRSLKLLNAGAGSDVSQAHDANIVVRLLIKTKWDASTAVCMYIVYVVCMRGCAGLWWGGGQYLGRKGSRGECGGGGCSAFLIENAVVPHSPVHCCHWHMCTGTHLSPPTGTCCDQVWGLGAGGQRQYSNNAV